MPLDEREQRILEEIERQFYKSDPKLAETVSKASPKNAFRRSLQRAAIGFVGGLVLMLAFFTSYTWIAMAGFVLMVGSAWMAAVAFRRRTPAGTRGGEGVGNRASDWMERLRAKWRRGQQRD